MPRYKEVQSDADLRAWAEEERARANKWLGPKPYRSSAQSDRQLRRMIAVADAVLALLDRVQRAEAQEVVSVDQMPVPYSLALGASTRDPESCRELAALYRDRLKMLQAQV